MNCAPKRAYPIASSLFPSDCEKTKTVSHRDTSKTGWLRELNKRAKKSERQHLSEYGNTKVKMFLGEAALQIVELKTETRAKTK